MEQTSDACFAQSAHPERGVGGFFFSVLLLMLTGDRKPPALAVCRNDGDLKLSRPCVASGFQSWLPGKRALARSRWRPRPSVRRSVGARLLVSEKIFFRNVGAMSIDSKYWLGRHVSRMTPPSERVVESANGKSSALAVAAALCGSCG